MATTTRTSLDVINGLREVWIKHRAENAVMTWLSAFGLTHHQVTKLIEELGTSCMEVLKANPYAIIPAIRGFGFKKVDKIARRMGTSKEHPERIRAGILFCIQDSLDSGGHCWTELRALVDEANELVGTPDSVW